MARRLSSWLRLQGEQIEAKQFRPRLHHWWLHSAHKRVSCSRFYPRTFLDCPSFFFSNDGKKFGGSIYQRCNDRLETGVDLSWTSGSNATVFGIATKYALDKDACVRAKVDNSSKIGLGYQQKLRDGKKWKGVPRVNFLIPLFIAGITLTLSTQIDAKNFNAGGHKVGCALELEA